MENRIGKSTKTNEEEEREKKKGPLCKKRGKRNVPSFSYQSPKTKKENKNGLTRQPRYLAKRKRRPKKKKKKKRPRPADSGFEDRDAAAYLEGENEGKACKKETRGGPDATKTEAHSSRHLMQEVLQEDSFQIRM